MSALTQPKSPQHIGSTPHKNQGGMHLIPILYEASERAFNTNGIGRLRDCISCKVTEERNGKYECELQYPITGKWYKQIVEGMYVSVIHDDTKTRQPFEIYKRSAPLDGVVTFYARHISYMANNIILNPFEASSASSAMSGIESNVVNTNPFTMWTDKTTSGNFKLEKPSSIRGILGGSRGSILDVYGGEYEFDKFTIKLYAHRGIDTDVTIRYGKNLTDLEQTVDNGTAYDSIVPFWFQDGVLVVPDEKIIGTTKNRPVTMDFTADFESQPTKTQLKNRATAFLNANQPWIPKENIKVDFIQLWQTEDYKDVAALQRVNMCDRVNVYYPALGVTAEKIKVIKTVYNVLTEQYDEMELGEARSTFAQTILKQTEEQMEAIRAAMVTSSMMDAAIEHATELITGGLGGHVVFTLNADGKPEEILIMDTDDVLTAVNVWRFNKNGLGHSHNGYSGPFSDVALTADGRINASMITTGTMSANRILGGTLKLGGANNGNGVLEVYDASGNRIGLINKDGADITGNMTIQRTISSILYKTYIGSVTANYWGDYFTRGGVEMSATSGNNVGKITFSPAPSPGVSTAGRGHVNLINSNRPLSITADDNTTSGQWSSVDLNEAKVQLRVGSGGSDSVVGVSVNYNSSYHADVNIGTGSIAHVNLGSNVYGHLNGRTSNAPNMAIDSSQYCLSTSSSKRYKRDISEEIPPNLDPHKLYDLPVKTYIYRDECLPSTDIKYGKRIIGFIAEDVDQIFPDACQYDEDHRPEMWNYMVLIPSMLKLIQEQKAKIDELETRISRLEKLIEKG